MKFQHGSRVVLLQPVQGEPKGAHGVVQRDTGSVVIVRFEESGRTVPIASEKLGNDPGHMYMVEGGHRVRPAD